MTASELRQDLKRLAERSRSHSDYKRWLERGAGEVLLKVAETPGVTLTEAAQLLGISRPTVYRLLEEARQP